MVKKNKFSNQITLSRCDDGITHIKLTPYTISFDELCKEFSHPGIGVKDGSYYVRGAAKKRNNESLKRADVVILDGDSSINLDTGVIVEGAPPPEKVHEALLKLDITHIIYTSHSHKTKGNRYRVLIPAKLCNQKELVAVVEGIIQLLHDLNVCLNNVKENTVWSQAWYYPRVPKENMSFFQFFSCSSEYEIDVQSFYEVWKGKSEKNSQPPTDTEFNKHVDANSPIRKFNSEHGNPDWIMSFLSDQGYVFKYTQQINNEVAYRFIAPDSSSGQAGVLIFKSKKGKWLVYSHHSDLLGESYHAHDAFSIYYLLKFNENKQLAIESFLKDTKTQITDFGWADKLELSIEEAEKISDPTWIVVNLVIKGHVHVFCAEPNGGKTTIFLHLAGEMVNDGYNVFYVNADTSGGDAKSMVCEANELGFKLLLPDLTGSTMDDIVDNLRNMKASGVDFNNVVFIFDTLKKMTDVINKTRAKELYKLLRSLSGKGMTIILLAHTNKYNDANGKPIFEGTGDLRADVDELIYLIPHKNDDGSMIVTTDPDKVRGKFKPVTFEIDSDRNVSLKDEYVDTAKINIETVQVVKDKQAIKIIDAALNNGVQIQKEIIKYCGAESIGKRTVLRVLRAYSTSIQVGMESHKLPCKTTTTFWRKYRKGIKNTILYKPLKPQIDKPKIVVIHNQC